MLPKNVIRSAVICALLLPLGPIVFAQARIGSVQGVVKDPTGALVPNAKVTIIQPVTGYKQSVTTDAQGAFKLVNIPFNTYKVQAEAAGFQPAEQSVDVDSTVPLNVEIALPLEQTTAP
jgi:hypothetical protein